MQAIIAVANVTYGLTSEFDKETQKKYLDYMKSTAVK